MRTNDELHHAAMIDLRRTRDYEAFCALLHEIDSVYLDPFFGEYRGRKAIRDWLVPTMAKAGAVHFEELYEPILTGDRSFVEWVWKFVLADGSERIVNRGCSVRQYADGWIVYAADYFDTHPLRSAEVRAIGEAAGATIDASDLPADRR